MLTVSASVSASVLSELSLDLLWRPLPRPAQGFQDSVLKSFDLGPDGSEGLRRTSSFFDHNLSRLRCDVGFHRHGTSRTTTRKPNLWTVIRFLSGPDSLPRRLTTPTKKKNCECPPEARWEGDRRLETHLRMSRAGRTDGRWGVRRLLGTT